MHLGECPGGERKEKFSDFLAKDVLALHISWPIGFFSHFTHPVSQTPVTDENLSGAVLYPLFGISPAVATMGLGPTGPRPIISSILTRSNSIKLRVLYNAPHQRRNTSAASDASDCMRLLCGTFKLLI